MIFEKIKRKTKLKKSEMLTFRLTQDEYKKLCLLKETLEFQTMRELVLFCLDVVEKLHEWNSLNYRFYIGNNDTKDYKEIQFELKPNHNDKERR